MVNRRIERSEPEGSGDRVNLDKGYKVIKFRCGCKMIFILDPEKAILKRGRCPIHWKDQEYIILWCQDCGVEIKTSPQGGHSRRTCVPCGKLRIRDKQKSYHATGGYDAARRKKQKPEIRHKVQPPQCVLDEQAFDQWFEEIHVKFAPPNTTNSGRNTARNLELPNEKKRGR